MCPTTHQRPSWTLNRAAEDRLSAPLSRALQVNCTDSPRLDDTTTTTTSASRQTRPSPSPSPRPVVAPPTQTISQQTYLTLPNPPATIPVRKQPPNAAGPTSGCAVSRIVHPRPRQEIPPSSELCQPNTPPKAVARGQLSPLHSTIQRFSFTWAVEPPREEGES